MTRAIKIIFIMLFALTVRAQNAPITCPSDSCVITVKNPPESLKTYFMFGPEGGYDFSNIFIGFETKVEIPIGHHLELNGQANINPYESHIALGHGFGYVAKPGAIVWVNNTSGFEGVYSYGGYSVTKVSKAAEYIYGGYVYRHTMFGMPTRFHFDYLQQIHNGVSNGIETNQVKGGSFAFDTLEGCFKSGCVRSEFEWNAGRVLNQGNPVCDGSGLPNPQKLPACPRGVSASGGFQINVLFEFPRRKDSLELF